MGMNERASDVSISLIFRTSLPPDFDSYKPDFLRYGYRQGGDEVTLAFANKYTTVSEIRGNLSEIRGRMRAVIKKGVEHTIKSVTQTPSVFHMIQHSYGGMAKPTLKPLEEDLKIARSLAEYTDTPQEHLAEVQELEKQTREEINQQVKENKRFAGAYIHEASEIVESSLEKTKGEVIENIFKLSERELTNKHHNTLKASVQGRANRKLLAKIYNEVFEEVRRDIANDPIERGENHPRAIADKVKKTFKNPCVVC